MDISKWLKEWHVICVKVKYFLCSVDLIFSLTWCMYQCEYDMSWLQMLKTLSHVGMNDMRPWMMLRGSFMWNLEPSDKDMNVEVESSNGILQVKEW